MIILREARRHEAVPPAVRMLLVMSAVGLLSWGTLVFLKLERRAAAADALYDRFRSGAR